MKEIQLTRGLKTVVDDEDFEKLNKHKWCAHFNKGNFYAVRVVATPKGDGKYKNKFIAMHRVILRLRSRKIEADHIDGNGLNNQRSNLRPTTRKQNGRNTRLAKNNTSGFRGVNFYSKYQSKPWRACIYVNDKCIYLGLHATKSEAALAYNKAAVKFFGRFARLNEVQV